jgi:hypothetical protein
MDASMNICHDNCSSGHNETATGIISAYTYCEEEKIVFMHSGKQKAEP